MAKTFAEAASASLTTVMDSSAHSTDRSHDNAHLVETLRLWRAMLPSKARDDVSGELVLRGYQMMLGNLSKQALDALTAMVLDQCTFFPTIAEIRQIMAKESYSNPFYVAARQQALQAQGYIEHQRQARRVANAAAPAALTDRSNSQ